MLVYIHWQTDSNDNVAHFYKSTNILTSADVAQTIHRQTDDSETRPSFVFHWNCLPNVDSWECVYDVELTNNTDNVSEREDITIVNETIGWRYLIHLRQIHEIDTILTFN